MRRLADRVMTALASLLTHVFFRHVEVEGGDNLPRHGPLVVIANHTNGLVDGLLLMATLRRYPRFLGKSTLFRIVPLRPFLKLAGVVPVYRRSDNDHPGPRDAPDGSSPAPASPPPAPAATAAAAPDRNETTFRTSRELLARGGVIAVFPEGISHNEPALQPLRTGAARIALGAVDEGTEAVATVAVGLVYDAKATFRSRALVRVGPAHPVAPWGATYRKDPHATVRALTGEMADQLHEVVTTYRSWRDAEFLAAIADVVARPGPPSPDLASPGLATPGLASPDLAGNVESAPALADRERLAAAWATIDLDATTEGRAFKEAYQSYQRDLALMGLADAQVTASYGSSYRRALAWSMVKVAVAVPPAAVGVAVHAVPFQVMKAVAKLPRDESIKSTVKVLGCFALFTIEYLVIAEVVRRRRGVAAAVAAFVAAPLSGYAALRLGERAEAMGGWMEGARIVRARRVVLPTVLSHRAEVIRRARDLHGLGTQLESD